MNIFIKGYVLPMHGRRYVDFLKNDVFDEPVDEFDYHRGWPLPTFVFHADFHNQPHLTHIAVASRGTTAGTGKIKLRLREIYELKSAISLERMLELMARPIGNKVKRIATNEGGLLTPESLEALIQAVSQLAEDTRPLLDRYRELRTERISQLGARVTENLAVQKEAVATAMTIAGIDRKELRGWEVPRDREPLSFLDGLPQRYLREDQMIINDLHRFGDFTEIGSDASGAVTFENDDTRLTVVMANRLPLEQQTGADLIYYHEKFQCFVLVQYKAMEQERSGSLVFRFPNEQLEEELSRMRSMLRELQKLKGDISADEFRLNENPFFLKICPRIQFEPDNTGLVKGMYLPLGYWDCISQHPEMSGPQGGSRLTFQNVRRYLNNTDFCAIIRSGWIGTNAVQSSELRKLIRSIVETGKCVVFAIAVPKEKEPKT
ncbi:MAG: hypothetical protein EOP84_01000 [Verrucomicrobiaceae bacterium]|nr:MAG: hypothetical protein EOP84_01000 [Verrucomicrobiaceae bacterium]